MSYQQIEIGKLLPSKYNSRKELSLANLVELSASIKERGVLVPLIVRELEKVGFEIVCGYRRYTAAKNAGLKLLPCDVREMSDYEAYELMLIENLHREDVHPLDECQAFELLITKQKVEDIARRVNKTVSYVKRRLALENLTSDFKRLFYEQKIGLAQAQLLCSLTHADQKEIARLKMESFNAEGGKAFKALISEHELRAFISDKFMLLMKNAKFNTDDPALVTYAGACSVCPKRTGINPDLFGTSSQLDRCTDKSCFERKTMAMLKLKEKDLKQKNDKVIMALREDYGNKVIIEGKRLTPVSLKEFPDAIPVIITGSEHKWSSDNPVGKVVYVPKDLKERKVVEPKNEEEKKLGLKKLEEKKKDEAVKLQNKAFKNYLINMVFDKLTKPNDQKGKGQKKYKAVNFGTEVMTEVYKELYNMPVFDYDVLFILSGGAPINILTEDFSDVYKKYAGEKRKIGPDAKAEKQVMELLLNLPAESSLVLMIVVCLSSDSVFLLEQKDILYKVAMNLRIDMQELKKSFPGIHKRALQQEADKLEAEKTKAVKKKADGKN